MDIAQEIQSRTDMAIKYEEEETVIGKMNMELKKRIMKCLVWTAALYAAQTWMLTRIED